MEPRFGRQKSVFETHGENVWRFAQPKLRPPQKDAIQNTLNTYAKEPGSTKPVVIVMPTGSGKTGAICLLPYALRVERALIIAPSLHIRDQLDRSWGTATYKSPDNIQDLCFFYKTGIFSSAEDSRYTILPRGHTILRSKDLKAAAVQLSPLHITNPHKFRSKYDAAWREMEQNLYDLVIVDEAHHLPATFWTEILNHFTTAKKVFFTATPFKDGGKPICADIEDRIIYRLTRGEAEEGRFVRPLRFELCAQDQVMDRVYQEVRSRGRYTEACKAIIAAANKATADDICRIGQQPQDPDYKCIVYYSGTDRSDLASFEQPGKHAIVVVKMLMEGYDHPQISIAAITCNIQSMLKFSQFIGRAMRVHSSDPRPFDALIIGDELQLANFSRLDTFVGDDPQQQRAIAAEDQAYRRKKKIGTGQRVVLNQ
eukprot:TRINITY_DN901_c0_g1_i3.p1 TRINITY_DN901_c0_g1~~TRINITY_DN901_c0_g1_i3.p1  ORF type:complete len:427 (+),score=42.17 TRINITY_DN901_c0_g1_i3:1394-2674(+)